MKNVKDVNIVDFLLSIGDNIVCDSSNKKYWRLVNHDSLVIDSYKNYFTWNSRGVSGNLVTYLMEVHGMDFKQANAYILNKVNGGEVKDLSSKYKVEYLKSFDPKKLNTVKNDQVIYNYLCNVRGISKELVSLLIQRNLVKVDNRNNVVFLWEAGKKVVGADLQGTFKTQKAFTNGKFYFKKVMPTTEQFTHFGFNIKVNGFLPRNLVFFEAPIDLISYLDLHKGGLKDTWLISMSGLKATTIGQCLNMATAQLKRYGQTINSVKLAVDNDESGKAFVKKMSNWEIQADNTTIDFEPELPKKADHVKKMDWNELLKTEKGIK